MLPAVNTAVGSVCWWETDPLPAGPRRRTCHRTFAGRLPTSSQGAVRPVGAQISQRLVQCRLAPGRIARGGRQVRHRSPPVVDAPISLWHAGTSWPSNMVHRSTALLRAPWSPGRFAAKSVARLEDQDAPPVGSVSGMTGVDVQSVVFDGGMSDRNTLRVGIVVSRADRPRPPADPSAPSQEVVSSAATWLNRGPHCRKNCQATESRTGRFRRSVAARRSHSFSVHRPRGTAHGPARARRRKAAARPEAFATLRAGSGRGPDRCLKSASSRNVWRFSRIVKAGLSGSRSTRFRICAQSSDLTRTHVHSPSRVKSIPPSTPLSFLSCTSQSRSI